MIEFYVYKSSKKGQYEEVSRVLAEIKDAE